MDRMSDHKAETVMEITAILLLTVYKRWLEDFNHGQNFLKFSALRLTSISNRTHDVWMTLPFVKANSSPSYGETTLWRRCYGPSRVLSPQSILAIIIGWSTLHSSSSQCFSPSTPASPVLLSTCGPNGSHITSHPAPGPSLLLMQGRKQKFPNGRKDTL